MLRGRVTLASERARARSGNDIGHVSARELRCHAQQVVHTTAKMSKMDEGEPFFLLLLLFFSFVFLVVCIVKN